MKLNLLIFFVLLLSLSLPDAAQASIADLFKDEEGRTKWQHVANFSASLLIVLLSIAVTALLVSVRKFWKVNRALKEIKRNLEVKVKQRTQNLDESNTLLKEANNLLEGEIQQHKKTAGQLRISQNYLYSILESLPSILIGLNEKMQVTHWNKMAGEISGTPAEQALGMSLWDAYPAITISKDQIDEVFTSGQSKQIKHSQRGQYYFDIVVFPLKTDRGVVVLIDNVTQKTLAENMLIQRDKMASMGELAASMAYDIKTPLEGILEDVEAVTQELLQENVEESPAEAALNDALVRGKQATAIIDNLLEFSRNKDGEMKATNPQELIENSLRLARDVLSQPNGLSFRDVKIEKKVASELPQFECLAAELQQVFLGVFRHSLQRMARVKEKGYAPGITIDVYEEMDSLWFRIAHNGQPLSEQEQRELFEPFLNSVSTIKPQAYEFQNRLSFSHFIVTEQHEGEMAVTSSAEQGTCFHLQFLLNKQSIVPSIPQDK
jgi:nitrogen fixation/metabolism regulation signal transduction histidine kinase